MDIDFKKKVINMLWGLLYVTIAGALVFIGLFLLGVIAMFIVIM